MFELATAAQMKRMDQRAIQDRGIPSTVLMERAAQGILLTIEDLMEDAVPGREKRLFLPTAQGEVLTEEGVFPFTRNGPEQGRTAAVFSGPGNNGGDGVAVAGLLKKAGWTVRCFLVGRREKMTADSREMERRLNELGGVLEDYIPGDGEQEAFTLGADIIVDALFGVGLNSPLREPGASAVRLMNLSDAKVVSADIPSGVETDTGRVLGAEERIPVEAALRAVTQNAALQYGLEKELGTLRPGKRADFVLLSGDPLRTPPEELKKLQVERTIRCGRTIWSR